jgi:hypothetical protein
MFVSQPVAQARYDLCKACDRFNKTLYTCKECGCFMKVKVKFSNSFCPINKWNAYKIESIVR